MGNKKLITLCESASTLLFLKPNGMHLLILLTLSYTPFQCYGQQLLGFYCKFHG